MAVGLETLHLLLKNEARVERIVLLGHDDGLGEARAVHGNGAERACEDAEIVVRISGRP